MKNTSKKKTDGCKAAITQFDESGIICMEQLRAEREKIQQIARIHAKLKALDYYELPEELLRKMVFANWLNQHAFTEKFEPMDLIGN